MIFVFKTSVQNIQPIQWLTPYMDKLLTIAVLNFDLADIDSILRINTVEHIVSIVIDILNKHGFICEELT